MFFLSVPQLINVGFPFASQEELPINSSLTTTGSDIGRDNTTKEASTANKRLKVENLKVNSFPHCIPSQWKPKYILPFN